jgi:hypothetical protein
MKKLEKHLYWILPLLVFAAGLFSAVWLNFFLWLFVMGLGVFPIALLLGITCINLSGDERIFDWNADRTLALAARHVRPLNQDGYTMVAGTILIPPLVLFNIVMVEKAFPAFEFFARVLFIPLVVWVLTVPVWFLFLQSAMRKVLNAAYKLSDTVDQDSSPSLRVRTTRQALKGKTAHYRYKIGGILSVISCPMILLVSNFTYAESLPLRYWLVASYLLVTILNLLVILEWDLLLLRFEVIAEQFKLIPLYTPSSDTEQLALRSDAQRRAMEQAYA